MIRTRMAGSACATALALLGGSLLAPPVGASERQPTDVAPAQAAAIVNVGAGKPAAGTATAAKGVAADLDGGDVAVSTDPDQGLMLHGDGGPQVQIGVPGGSADDGVRSGGNVVYDDIAHNSALVARPTEEGVQARVVIDGSDAPNTFGFPVTVDGADADLSLTPAGIVEVRPVDSAEIVATVQPAWATDANGRAVPTHFRIEGNNLVQVVDHHGAVYPVIADPNTCGWVTCTYYFGKMATRDIARASVWGGGCGLLKGLPPVLGGCVAAFGAVNYQANRAVNRRICLKIKYSRVVAFPVWYPDIYGDRRYCK